MHTHDSLPEVMKAMREAGFGEIRAERPTPATKWNVAVATRL